MSLTSVDGESKSTQAEAKRNSEIQKLLDLTINPKRKANGLLDMNIAEFNFCSANDGNHETWIIALPKEEPSLQELMGKPKQDCAIPTSSTVNTSQIVTPQPANNQTAPTPPPLVNNHDWDPIVGLKPLPAGWNQVSTPKVPKKICGLCYWRTIEKHRCFNKDPLDFETPNCGFVLFDNSTRDTVFAFFTLNYKFYTDQADPNHTAYYWDSNRYNRDCEGLRLKHMANIFGTSPRNLPAGKEEVMQYLQGYGMNTQVENKPLALISFNNGLLDLNSMTLNEFSSDYFIINVIPHNYDPNAKCPKWEKFIGEVHLAEDIPLVQEWWGYNLWSGFPKDALMIYHGEGQNGKGVVLMTQRQILGGENVSTISLHQLNLNPFMAAELYGKLACISNELASKSLKDVGLLKEISSGAPMTVHRKNGQPFQMLNYAKPTYSGNFLPPIDEDDDAIWDRMHIVRCLTHFVIDHQPAKGEKWARDKDKLISELLEEAPGIINWMIEGLQRLRRNNWKFSDPMSRAEVRRYYRYNASSVYAFLEDKVIKTGNYCDTVAVEQMWNEYEYYCVQIHPKNIRTKRQFFDDMKQLGFAQKQIGSAMSYIGVSLKP